MARRERTAMTDEEKRIDDTELRRSLYTIVTTHKDHAGGLSKNAHTCNGGKPQQPRRGYHGCRYLFLFL